MNHMTFIDGSQATNDAPLGPTGPAQPEIADLLGIARRGWLFIAAGAISGLICASIIVTIIPPIYKASARITFERTLQRYMQANKVTNEPIIEDYDALGQAYVIASESVLLQVIRSLSLASDPDFAGTGQKHSDTIGSRVRDLFQSTAKALGLPEKAEDQLIDPRKDPEKVALDTVLRNLTVNREDVASVMTIAFTWKDPVKAATIANAIVDTYMKDSMAEKMNSTNVARMVAQQRAEELKQQVQDADRALLEYKAVNKLVGTDQLTLSHGQLNVLQTQLTNADLAMSDAKARMQQNTNDASALFVADNDLIRKLRGDELDLINRAHDIEGLVGKDHLAAVKARKRVDDVREAIASEQRRIAGSSIKDYELARARYDQLSAAVSRVVGSEGANSNALSRLRDLENNLDSLRALYNRMLLQSSEANKVEAQPSIATPDARVLMRATPPLQTESSKKRLLIVAGGSVMGLLLGAAFVLARNFPFGVFRTSQQVTHATGLPCEVLPEISTADEQSSLRTGEYLLDWPYSRFAQTLRSLWATINVAQRESGAKVVCVVSSNPGEGKTTVAINLAAHFALHSATRVLVVDADFHRQSLTNRVAPDARVGFREALEKPTELANFVVRKERLNLDALPCPVPDRIPNAAELFGSVQMEQLIEVARETYDLVIIEAPPIAAVVDYKLIARHCDGFIFVVEWGKTSQRLVLECLSDASAVMDRVLCMVLNKADLSALRSIESYKGDGFHAYYSEQKRV
jgi:succinoglycan biosynthesis transport protein ExoP